MSSRILYKPDAHGYNVGIQKYGRECDMGDKGEAGMMKNLGGVFISALLAGIAIALGGTVFLSLENKVLGALFFTVGLFTVCTLGLNLFTGKVCYVFEQDLAYAARLPVIWLGNLAGAWLTAALERLTRIGPHLRERALAVCEAKLNDGLLSILVLAMFCNILIYLAVDGYRNNPQQNGISNSPLRWMRKASYSSTTRARQRRWWT